MTTNSWDYKGGYGVHAHHAWWVMREILPPSYFRKRRNVFSSYVIWLGYYD